MDGFGSMHGHHCTTALNASVCLFAQHVVCTYVVVGECVFMSGKDS